MERIRAFPIVVLVAVLVVGIIVYWVSRKKDPPKEPADPAPPREVAPPKPVDPAPPPTNDPGQKILDGADGAFRAEMFPTALKFYKDFELRYAGTEVYDRNLTRLWERIHSSNALSPKDKQDPELPAYLEARRKLADEWKKLQPLMDAAPTPESKAEVDKFAGKLPPQDGRRKGIDAWRERK
jgi:hypothetical protein